MSVVSSTTITCLTPAQSTGYVTVTVTNVDTLSASLANAFQYVNTATSSNTFGQLSAGGTMTGTGVMLRFSLGWQGNPATQTSSGVTLKTGNQGVINAQ